MRELARSVLQHSIRRLESDNRDQTVSSFRFEGELYRRNRRTPKRVDTRFGQVTFDRWFFQNTQPESPGIAPLDVRLGVVAGRMTPALAEVTGRLAADLPQQATLDMLSERFSVRPSVEAYRRVVADLATQVRCVHDHEAVGQLIDWIEQARQSEGKHDVLLQVGRDGVYVQTRPCWEEASCGTLAVYDRDRKRVGTIYLGQMPESEQPTMSKRLTYVIEGVLRGIDDEVPTLRYVTDAGCHPQSYFRKILSKMKHPVTGRRLKWSWGEDFFSPWQNGLCESFNGKLRDEYLNEAELLNESDTRLKARAWREDFNDQRPHSSLGYLTPSEFARRCAVSIPLAALAPRKQHSELPKPLPVS